MGGSVVNFWDLLPYGKEKSERDFLMEVIYDRSKNVEFDLISAFPCLECRGRGSLKEICGYHNDYCYEDCNTCKNSGFGEKRAWKDCYKSYKENRQRQLLTYKERFKQLKEIRKKLKPLEIAFVEQWGIKLPPKKS